MGVVAPRAPESATSSKNLVMGPRLLVNCYLEIKFYTRNQGEPSLKTDLFE